MPKPDENYIRISDVIALEDVLRSFNARISALESPDPIPSPSKKVISPENIEYVGEIGLHLGGEFTGGMGLTIRTSDNSFLALTHYPTDHWSKTQFGLYRIPIPPIGGTANTYMQEWPGIGHGNFNGIYYDNQTHRLWVTGAIDYPNDEQITSTKALMMYELSATDGFVDRGPFGIPNKYARRWFGGVTPIPQWFQDKYSVPPFLTGFGGYLSRISWGPAMGLTAYAIPDPIEKQLQDNTEFNPADVKILADPGENSWINTDWYPAGKPDTYDRGGRMPNTHHNFYDSGTFHDESTITQWKIAPDGRTRWTWGDQYGQNVVWLDTPTHHGLLAGLIAHCGHTWYETSTLHYETKVAEFHIYDPTHLGEVAQGTRKPFELQPVHLWRPSEIPVRGAGSGNTPDGTIFGICQHPETGHIYVRRTQAGGTWPNTYDQVYIYRLVGLDAKK